MHTYTHAHAAYAILQELIAVVGGGPQVINSTQAHLFYLFTRDELLQSFTLQT